jgi:hypothetical protein
MRRATVRVAGKRVKVIGRGRRLTALVDLRGLSARKVKVRVVGRSAKGRTAPDPEVLAVVEEAQRVTLRRHLLQAAGRTATRRS